MFAHSKLELLFSWVRKPHRPRFNENSNGISRTSKIDCASYKHTMLCLVLIICTCSLCVSTLTKVKIYGMRSIRRVFMFNKAIIAFIIIILSMSKCEHRTHVQFSACAVECLYSIRHTNPNMQFRIGDNKHQLIIVTYCSSHSNEFPFTNNCKRVCCESIRVLWCFSCVACPGVRRQTTSGIRDMNPNDNELNKNIWFGTDDATPIEQFACTVCPNCDGRCRLLASTKTKWNKYIDRRY